MIAVAFWIGVPLLAQEPGGWRARAVRVEQAPLIDGRLDDPAWQRAPAIAGLSQVEPTEGAAPASATEVWILYDSDCLYLGFRCAEPAPSAIVATRLRRDEAAGNDDRVEWVLDTFHDRTNAYRFSLSAAGQRRDELAIANGFRTNPAWDAVWEGRTAIGDGAWTAEVAIPFATIAFDPAGSWGFNVQRFRGRDRSLDRWAGPQRGLRLEVVKAAGTLHGLEGLRQGLGLEFLPYFKGATRLDDASDERAWTGDFGGDLVWRLSSALTAGFTWHTDFAETEVDDQVINVTRFPTFFPEKREFFLEDASLFDFGPVRGRDADEAPDLVAFHSRTIGLVAGQEIPLDYGARLAGRAGPFELGFLGVHTGGAVLGTGPAAVAVPAGETAVVRPTWRVGPSLQLGGYFASGDPTSTEPATTSGADLRYFSNRLIDGFFGVNAYFMASSDGASDRNDVAYGLQGTAETDDWSFTLSELAVGADFRPALGFVRRTGIHRHGATVRWRPRPELGPIRNLDFLLQPRLYTDLSGDLESYSLPIGFFGLETDAGDRVGLTAFLEGDRPAAPFPPAPGSLVPAGAYDWWRGGAAARTSTSRSLSAALEARGGDWYDGQLREWLASAAWRPSAHVRLEARYFENYGRMPGGDFTLRVEQLLLDWNPTAALSWQNLVQAENLGRTLGAQSRLRWILADGRELFVVLGSEWVDDTRSLQPIRSDLAVKVVYALRF